MKPNEKIKEIREKVEHLSQKEFANKYGIKINAIGFIERGIQAIPDELALALEKEYGIPFKWWKTGMGEPEAAKERPDNVRELSLELNILPDVLKQILQASSSEPELMLFAAKAVNEKNSSALERFYRILQNEFDVEK